MKKYFKKERGMTLVEILVAVAIFSAIMVTMGVFQSNVFKINNFLQNSLTVQQEARKILRPFIGEIRGARISEAGSFPIEQAEKDSLIFYSDIDSDGLVERVRYFQDGDEFKKGVIKPSGNPVVYDENNEDIEGVVSWVVNDGNNPIFEYFDSSYDGLEESSPLSYPINFSSVSLVKVRILLDNNINEAPGAFEVSSKATFRNL